MQDSSLLTNQNVTSLNGAEPKWFIRTTSTQKSLPIKGPRNASTRSGGQSNKNFAP